MYLLGIDMETTGLDPSSDIIEVGYMVWDSSLSCSVECASYLIKYNKPLPEDIKKTNRNNRRASQLFWNKIKTSS